MPECCHASIFARRGAQRRSSTSRQFPDTKKGVNGLFVLDSDVEVGFCRDLEASDEVKVYTKLPRGFYIDTPVGKYNPDWAIVFEHNSA
jgi:type III restriction enzyme